MGGWGDRRREGWRVVASYPGQVGGENSFPPSTRLGGWENGEHPEVRDRGERQLGVGVVGGVWDSRRGKKGGWSVCRKGGRDNSGLSVFVLF